MKTRPPGQLQSLGRKEVFPTVMDWMNLGSGSLTETQGKSRGSKVGVRLLVLPAIGLVIHLRKNITHFQSVKEGKLDVNCGE